MTTDHSEFRTPDELRDLLDRIGRRLHTINRVGGGESVYLWHVAETIRAVGRLAHSHAEGGLSGTDLGDGVTQGIVSTEDGLDHFLKLLKVEINSRY